MAKRPILTVPHPILKTKADPVDSVNDAVRAQMDDMLETMADIGIGLAANQIGMLNRVLVMDVDRDGFQTGPICMANPEIFWFSDEISQMDEGCLSIPGQYALVERPARVKVRYLDYHGKIAELDAQGLVSHCVQHEIDHLNGILCIDYLSSLKRRMIVRKVEKMKKDQEVL